GKAAQGCRTPRRYARHGATRCSDRLWSAAALCRFSLGGSRSPKRLSATVLDRRIDKTVLKPASSKSARNKLAQTAMKYSLRLSVLYVIISILCGCQSARQKSCPPTPVEVVASSTNPVQTTAAG